MKKVDHYNFVLLYIKTSEATYSQRNRNVILNRAIDYYKNDKEWLWDNARDKYRHLSEEEKNKKRGYGKTDIIICLKKYSEWKNLSWT